MKKLLLTIFVSLMWTSISIAEENKEFKRNKIDKTGLN